MSDKESVLPATHFQTLAEMARECEAEYDRCLHSGWGRWHFVAQPFPSLTYFTESGGEGYWVDLREATTSSRVLDWIVQLSDKDWHTPQDLADFISAIVLLIDPQATLCSFGANKTLTEAELTMILDGHAERQAKNRE